MPVLDHFRPPLSSQRHWQSFHAGWASALAGRLNEAVLPDRYFAEEHVQIGPRVEIDLATFEETGQAATGGDLATTSVQTWAPPAPVWTVSGQLLDSFEVRVYSSEAGPQLIGVVELVSPANKDRPPHRRAFAVKCASYLQQGISLIVVDIVTSRTANLHNELMEILEVQPTTKYRLGGDRPLYVVAYRPVVRSEGAQIDLWPHTIKVGEELPDVPMYLSLDMAVPIELETTYREACKKHRIVVVP